VINDLLFGLHQEIGRNPDLKHSRDVVMLPQFKSASWFCIPEISGKWVPRERVRVGERLVVKSDVCEPEFVIVRANSGSTSVKNSALPLCPTAIRQCPDRKYSKSTCSGDVIPAPAADLCCDQRSLPARKKQLPEFQAMTFRFAILRNQKN
jgi:hypothetical protein